jgi:hypothetical protein
MTNAACAKNSGGARAAAIARRARGSEATSFGIAVGGKLPVLDRRTGLRLQHCATVVTCAQREGGSTTEDYVCRRGYSDRSD